MILKQNLQLLAILSLMTLSSHLSAQTNKYTISGYMQDSSTGEKLIGVNIFDAKSLKGSSSNTYGFYSLTIPADSVNLTLSYIGYESKNLSFMLTNDTTIYIDFNAAVELETVVVEAEKSVRRLSAFCLWPLANEKRGKSDL